MTTTATATREMTGTVTALVGRYFEVSCPSAPAHLQTLNLTPGQTRGAKVGDLVRLVYVTTSSFSLWSVAEVLPRPINPETGTIYSRAELETAFNLVAPTQDEYPNVTAWKMPIDRMVPAGTDLDRLRTAVTFYTGSLIKVTPVGSALRITAAGYYAVIGA